MSGYHGKNTTVLIDGADVSTYMTGADLSVEMDTADTTTFYATWKSVGTGVLSAKLDCTGLYDGALATLFTQLTNAAVLTYCPIGGNYLNAPARLLSVQETDYSDSSPVGGMVAFKYSALGSNTVGFGNMLHPMALDTGTTTGTGKDETTATTTGWTAHFHSGYVSSGSWVIKIQDSTDGSSDWADLAGATFTAATGVTAQRLTGAAGATVRRWVRYVATVTGGSSPTIAFALALARN
jgi:hypothetical protein